MGYSPISAVGLRWPGVSVPGAQLTTTDAKPSRRLAGRTSKRKPPRVGGVDGRQDERLYERLLNDVVRRMFGDLKAKLLPALPSIVSLDTSDGDDAKLSEIIESLKSKYTLAGAEKMYLGIARDMSVAIEGRHRQQTAGQLKSLGIDIFREAPEFDALRKRFVARNVRLIKSVVGDALDQTAKLIDAGTAQGLRHEEIASQIFERLGDGSKLDPSVLGKAENRARLIARDQVLTFQAELNRSRQRANGIERFIWRTVGDFRVRDLHENREGIEYTWQTGAGAQDTYPGVGVQCRCWAEPIL